jgi:hypothetical protein
MNKDGNSPGLRQGSKTVFMLRKEGRLDEALEMGRELNKVRSGDVWTNRALGWVLFDLAKAAVRDGNHDEFKGLLSEYASLQLLEKPGLLHSMFLGLAIRGFDHFKSFATFAQWWDPGNLRPEDFMSQKGEGDKVYPSLAEKLIKALYQAVKTGNQPEHLPWVTEFIGQNLARFPEQEWFPYYYGKLLVMEGRVEDARGFVVPIVKQKQGEFWAWAMLADTCSADESDMKRACLCRALLCRVKDEGFLCNVRLEMASVMKGEGAYPEAKHEIESIAAVRAEHGWKACPEVQSLQAESWYVAVTPSGDNRAYYEHHAPGASSFLLADIPWQACVLSRINREKRISVLTLGYEVVCLVPHTRYPALADAPEGSLWEIRVERDREKDFLRLLDFRPSDVKPAKEFYRDVEGILSIDHGHDFGFVGDVFVSPRVIGDAGFDDGDWVTGAAVRELNQKHGKPGWRAICLSPAERMPEKKDGML